MTNLVNDLLDLAKLENSAFQLNYEQFDLINVIKEAFQIIIFQAENKDIRLYLELDKHNPTIFCKIYSDKRRTLQILLNFISNSVKFTSNKGFIKVKLAVLEEQQLEVQKEEPKVIMPDPMMLTKIKRSVSNAEFSRVSQTQNKDVTKYIKMRMSIEDNGVGISAENQKKLFTDYTRLEEHQSMNAKGTGLGLSICKKIIEQMGGTVTIESEIGIGTKFNITQQIKVIEKQTNLQSPVACGFLETKTKGSHKKPFTSDFYQKFTKLDHDPTA